jgi:hypothetical protein
MTDSYHFTNVPDEELLDAVIDWLVPVVNQQRQRGIEVDQLVVKVGFELKYALVASSANHYVITFDTSQQLRIMGILLIADHALDMHELRVEEIEGDTTHANHQYGP